jgi:hypothetical protein
MNAITIAVAKNFTIPTFDGDKWQMVAGNLSMLYIFDEEIL